MPELRGLAYFSIDRAIEFLRASGGLLLPFTVTDDGSNVEVTQFGAERLEEALTNARASLEDAGRFARVVLVWDGYYKKDGETSDAVLLEAFDAESVVGLKFAQPYEKTGMSPNLIEPFGNVKLLSDTLARPY